MKCRNCGEKLANGTITCPKCGAAQNVKKKSSAGRIIIATFFLILGISQVFSAFTNSGKPEKVGSEGSRASKVETTAEPTYTVGDTLEMRNIRVTLNSVNESTGSNFIKPADGKIFVVCEYTIENNTNSDLSVSSIMNFEAYVDDYACNISLGAMSSSEKNLLDSTVAAGKKVNGVVGYEVDPDYKELELHYNPNLSGADFVFVYCK